MPLKLIVSKNDSIVMSNGIIIRVLATGKRTQLEIDAPKEVKVHTIFDDPSKQFKNLRKKTRKTDGQDMTPEEQRSLALQSIKRSNK